MGRNGYISMKENIQEITKIIHFFLRAGGLAEGPPSILLYILIYKFLYIYNFVSSSGLLPRGPHGVKVNRWTSLHLDFTPLHAGVCVCVQAKKQKQNKQKNKQTSVCISLSRQVPSGSSTTTR